MENYVRKTDIVELSNRVFEKLFGFLIQNWKQTKFKRRASQSYQRFGRNKG